MTLFHNTGLAAGLWADMGKSVPTSLLVEPWKNTPELVILPIWDQALSLGTSLFSHTEYGAHKFHVCVQRNTQDGPERIFPA